MPAMCLFASRGADKDPELRLVPHAKNWLGIAQLFSRRRSSVLENRSIRIEELAIFEQVVVEVLSQSSRVFNGWVQVRARNVTVA